MSSDLSGSLVIGQSVNATFISEESLEVQKSVKVVSSASGDIACSLQFFEERLAFGVAGSPDEISVLDANDGSIVRCQGHIGSVFDMCEVPATQPTDETSDHRFASCSADKTVRVWGENGEEVAESPVIPFAPDCLRFSRKTNRFWISGQDYAPYLQGWNPETNQTVSLSGATGNVFRLCLDEETETIYSPAVRSRGRMHVYRPEESLAPVSSFELNLASGRYYLGDIYLDKDSQCLFVQNYGTIGVYDIRQTATAVREFEVQTRGGPWSGEIHPVSSPGIFVSVNNSREITKWTIDGEILGRKAMPSRRIYTVVSPFEYDLRHGRLGTFVLPVEVTEEEKTRIRMVMESPLVEKLEIQAAEQVLATVPKCLLQSASRIFHLDQAKKHVIEGTFNAFEEDVFCRLLFGDVPLLPPRQLLNLYNLFRALGMKKHAFLTCFHAQNEKDLRGIAFFLSQAEKAFEEEEEGEEEDDDPRGETTSAVSSAPGGDGVSKAIHSAFTLACLNGLAANQSALQNDESLRACLGKLKVLVKVENHRVVPLHTHPEFEFSDEDDIPKSWTEVVRETLKQLHLDDSLSDVCVKTADAVVVSPPIPCHLAVLIWKTNFFHDMLHFQVGDEASSVRESATVTVEGLSAEALEALIEFVYLGRISANSFSVLIPVFVHAHKYRESLLQECVFAKIKEVTRDLVEEGDFELALISVASLLRSPTFVDIRKYLTEEARVISREKLTDLIEQSDRDRRFEAIETRQEEMGGRIEMIVGQIEKMGSHIEQVSSRLGQIEDTVAQLRRLMEEIKAEE